MVRTTVIGQQRRFVLPQPAQLTKGVRIDDLFHRATLNPQNAIPYYVVSTAGRGSAVPNIGPGRTSLSLLTSGSVGDAVDVRLSELCFERCKKALQEFRRVIKIKILFCPHHLKESEGFVGLMMGANGSIAELPTLAPHMGVYWDSSVGDSFVLTSSDGKSRNIKDTNIKVIPTEDYMIDIDWSNFNEAKLTFQGDNGKTTRQKQVTSLSSIDTAVLHFFIRNESTTPREVRIVHWTAWAY